MKIGWDRSSIRLRVTPGEVDSLGRGVHVNEEIALPWGGHWSATILPSAGATTCITLEGGHLRLFLADRDRAQLTGSATRKLTFGVTPEGTAVQRCAGRCEGCRRARRGIEDGAGGDAAETEIPGPWRAPRLHYVIEKDLHGSALGSAAPALPMHPPALPGEAAPVRR
jgi:hypothetical protein